MTKFDPTKHHRRSIRLKGYDYTQPGAYFITLVTWGRECLFGEVFSGEMHPNPFGRLIGNEWERLTNRFSKIVLDEWICMPNHLHGILMMVENNMDNVVDGAVGARQKSSRETEKPSIASPIYSSDIEVGARQKSSGKTGDASLASPLQNTPGSLGAIIGAYKSTTTRLINGLRRTPGLPLWQRNYYEHIIRNEDELKSIRAYVRDNPVRWELDPDNPTRILGV
jgi:putative transposase